MKKLTVLLLLSILLSAGFCADEPILVTNAPAHGTFRLLYQQPSPPYPFDPTYGALPIWLLNGVYYVDDSEVDYVTLRAWQLAESALSSPSPPGIGGGGGSSNVVCDGPTNFTFAYQANAAATNDVWLQFSLATSHTGLIRLHTADTNASYDLFATTNLSPCVPPVNLTNWCWVLRAPPQPVSFTWTNLDRCQVWFQAAKLTDDDGDGLTTAYEHLVSLTDPNVADTDDDGRSDAQELADATDPRSAGSVVFTRLAAFPFNDTNFTGGAGQLPLVRTNAISAAAWLSPGVQLANGTNAQLRYRGTETNGTANLNLRHGAVRFWFKSTWDTGAGPGTFARLLEVGTQGSGGTTNGWWALHFSQTNGSQIAFAAETNGAGATYLTGTVNWARCDWNQLVLNYTPSNTALYLNSSLVATGLGVTYWPGATVRADGFTVGSDASGGRQALGLFEDLETFNHPLATNDIAENFQTNRPPNAIADLQLWLKGDAGVLTNTAYARVSQWQDQSCFGHDATQDTAGLQPYVNANGLNGRPTIRFLTNSLNLASFLTGSVPAQAFVVVRADTNTSGTTFGLWHFGSAGSLHPHSSGEVIDSFGGTTTYRLGIFPEELRQFHIMDASAGTNWIFRHNGITKEWRRNHTVSFPSGLTLGHSSSSFFQGDIAEVLLYRRVLSEAERQRLIDYLQARYAVLPTPPVPGSVQATNVGSNQISLWWRTDYTEAQNWTRVERQTGGGDFAEIGTVAGASFIDTNVTPGTTYTYRLRASSDRAQASDYSSNVTVTTATNGGNIPLDRAILWLKADCGTTRTVAAPTSDEVMLVWLDQSGRENHALSRPVPIQPYPPILLTNGWNGRPVTRYTGNRLLDLVNLSSLTNGEAFIVLRTMTNPTPFTPTLWKLGVAASSYPNGPTDPRTFDYFGSTAFHPGTNAALTNYAYHLYNSASSNAYWSAQFNDEPRTTFFSANSVAFDASPALGGGGSTGFYGEIAEFVLFETILSESERAAIRVYFNSRYNIWTP